MSGHGRRGRDQSHPDAPALTRPILQWYDEHARDLPWRAPGATAWGILVSEVMLQQTPVARVLPVWQQWLETWPTPADLAAAPSGEAIRAWGRLGYPRRALRLHEAAVQIGSRFGGEMPSSYDELRSLPGIGDYTAAAVASFAFGQAHPVLDTNVRRVLARVIAGQEHPGPAITVAERTLATELLPACAEFCLLPWSDCPEDPTARGRDEATGCWLAARWSVAVMELGALVCTAASPKCAQCPVEEVCAWVAAGRPAYDGPARKVQAWAGTDRMVRGRILALLREAPGSVTRERLDQVWSEDVQRERALAGLLHDGLVIESGGRFALPS